MWLIVALFFTFLIEVCWLPYCVVYSLCKITQLEKQDNRKCIFATDGILEQNSVRRTFKCVVTETCLIMAAPHWWFCRVQWLFIHVIYINCLSFWLERKDSWKRKFRSSQWWPILDLAHKFIAHTLFCTRMMPYSTCCKITSPGPATTKVRLQLNILLFTENSSILLFSVKWFLRYFVFDLR